MSSNVYPSCAFEKYTVSSTHSSSTSSSSSSLFVLLDLFFPRRADCGFAPQVQGQVQVEADRFRDVFFAAEAWEEEEEEDMSAVCGGGCEEGD